MGLKTTNYKSKSTGIVLGNAYAVLKNLIIETDNRARAIFAVQQSRESASAYKPLDKVEVHFVWDRKSDPAEQAYIAAKTQMITQTDIDKNGNLVEKSVPGVLNGWKDDIV
ncbi:MAG: hypothetical protein IJX30_00555 [Clostridia bacterium]|nr:hypothetical protein [Clostridia bacterium]